MSLRFGPPTPAGSNPGHTMVDFGCPAGLGDTFLNGGTLMAWIYLLSYGDTLAFASGVGHILSKTEDATVPTGWRWYTEGSNNLMQFRHGFTTQRGHWVTPDNSILLNTWYHVAVTYDRGSDANDPLMYIDGVSVTVTENFPPIGSPTSDSAVRLTMGELTGLDTRYGFEGYMRDVLQFNTILAPEAINRVAKGKGIDFIHSENRVMWLRLDDESHRRSPDFVSTCALSHNNGNQTTITVDMPGEIVDGNQQILVLVSSGVTGVSDARENMTTTAGWIHINIGQTDLPAAGSTPSVWVYRRIASSEPASYVFTGNQSSLKSALVMNMRNTPIAFPTIPDVVSSINTGTNSSPTAPSITPSDNALAFFIAVADDDDIIDGGHIDNWPEDVNGRMDYEDPGGSTNNGHSMVIATQLVDGGVATGTRLFPLQASEEWGCISFAFIAGQGARPGGVCTDYTDNNWANRMLQHPHNGPTDSSAITYDEENPPIHNQRTR